MLDRRASPTLIAACTLLMNIPSIKAALSGALTIDTLCLRLGLAVVGSYIGVRMITRIIAGYAASPRYAPTPERIDRAYDENAGT